MKKTSLSDFYLFHLIMSVFIIVIGIIGTVFAITQLFKVFQNVLHSIVYTCLMIVFIAVFIAGLKRMIVLLKDYSALKSKIFCSVIGKVIGFKRNVNPEDGKQYNTYPIIEILQTKEIITLHVNDKVMIGKKYKFNYLSNSKLAEVAEKTDEI